MVRISCWTCFFLVTLRLMIGWHFATEGYQKIRSSQIGTAEINKPFTSKMYFAQAEGPLGSTIRELLGTDDAATLAKLELVGKPEDEPLKRVPSAIAEDYEKYGERVVTAFKLDAAKKDEVLKAVEAAKVSYVKYIAETDVTKVKAVKRTIENAGPPVSYDPALTMTQRINDYRKKLDEMKEIFAKKLTAIGKDGESDRLVKLRSDITTTRVELNKDIDEQADLLKTAIAKIVEAPVDGLPALTAERTKDDAQIDTKILEMLTPREGSDFASRFPAALEAEWNKYVTYVKEHAIDTKKFAGDRVDEIARDAKIRFVRFVSDQDQFSGAPLAEKEFAERLKAYKKAIADAGLNDKSKRELESMRKEFIADITRHTLIMQNYIGGFDADERKGTLGEYKPISQQFGLSLPVNRQEWLDSATRYGLTAMGICLLLGFCTRLACLAAASFLLIEFLSNTPLPWLPVSPKSEGNYLFINKNFIEFMALIMLATTASGKWFGVDALFGRGPKASA